jgi:ribosome-associated protein
MSDFGDLRISADLTLPAWEISEAFVRASGPGGQNVNKVSSAVQLTWQVSASSLPAGIKERFQKLYGSRITADGRLIL